MVQKGGKFGFINESGKEVVPPIYDKVGNFNEVTKDWALVEAGGLKGFINREGYVVVPVNYTEIGKFDSIQKDWAVVKDNRNKMGFIDKSGKEIIAVSFDNVEAFTKKTQVLADVD